VTFDGLWESIIDVGRHPGSGGYRRFAWSTTDLTLREWFSGEANQRGMSVEEDRNGNLWAWWMPPGYSGDPRDAFVTGSHLDSVPDGGPFDGPLGIVAGFAAIDILRQRGVMPRRPVGVAAFSDEEGARFGVACVGSQLSAGALTAERALGLRDVDGTTLADAMTAAGRDPHRVGADPTLTDRVGVYVELHVEQGRALDLVDRPLAVASAIWPHGRWRFSFRGEANHAGATRLVDRRDPMLTFATAVHDARTRAAAHQAVATFGKVHVTPNGANAIPSQVLAWLDARAADESTLTKLVTDITADAARNAEEGRTTVAVEAESVSPAVHFPDHPRQRIQRVLAPRFGELPVLPTAAGHDAGVLSAVLPTAMLFVRNPTGISHSPDEYAEISDCRRGAEALAAVMGDWVG
jgi:beta-ureidopropionase / N-carbamoyl-L-amino-acid hydrolase